MRNKRFALLALLLIVGIWAFFYFGGWYFWMPSGQTYRDRVASRDYAHHIYVVKHGWHTGIILEAKEIETTLIPEVAYFPDSAGYYEFGWGDAGFYQAETINAGLAISALLLPTSSVVHMVGLDASPSYYFPESQIVSVPVTASGLHRLQVALSASYARLPWQKAVYPLRRGIYGDSYFFRGAGAYSALRTCNHWTAEMLSAAGVPILRFPAATAHNLIGQAERYAQ